MKKIIILFFALIFVFQLYACNGGTDTSETSTNQSSSQSESEESKSVFDLEPQSKSIKVWIMDSDPENQVVLSFLQAYPGYDVDFSVSATNPFGTPDKTLDLARLAAAMASGDAPDLFLGYMATLEAYYTDMFIPLNDYLENDPDYNYENCEEITFKNSTFNGQTYFLPFALSTDILVWNKDMFEEFGLDPEIPPTTWAEALEMSNKLTSFLPSGKPKTIGMEPSKLFKHIRGFHISAGFDNFTDESGINLWLNTPDYNTTLEFIRSVGEVFGGFRSLPPELDFLQGTIGISNFSADGLVLLPVWTDFEFGIAPLPKQKADDPDYTPYFIDNLLGIPKASSNPNGGWLFAKHMMTDYKFDDAMQWYQMSPDNSVLTYITHIPTRESTYEYYADILTEKSWELIRKRDEIMQGANIPEYDIATQAEFDKYFDSEYVKMLRDELSPQDLLINGQKYGESLIDEFRVRKEAEGWTFTDEGKAIPPGN